MLKKVVFALSLFCLISISGQAQSTFIAEFKPVCDSVSTLLKARTSVTSRLTLEKIMKRGHLLDFYFNEKLADYPWRSDDVQWLKSEMKSLFPAEYKHCKIGQIFCKRTSLSDLVVPNLKNDGKSSPDDFRVSDPRKKNFPYIVQNPHNQLYNKGLSGRYIALWQSHGRYYEAKTERWEWQRAPLFRTVEDMYTQSYVLPFLMPMLENAGAFVMTPRERDTQVHEVVVDNDPTFTDNRTGLTRGTGEYKETGTWTDAGTGFSDKKMIYTGNDNPFTMGTVRQTNVTSGKYAEKAEARWIPSIPERGKYAVYISYKTLPNSTTSAHYTVHHLGGDTEFIVNQTMGGSTWIYLGTFEFAKGTEASVAVDNSLPSGRKFVKGSVVTADAVKIGGGMGKIARGLDSDPVSSYTLSGLPSFAEGALYWMQWAGVDSTITKKWENDYTNDYADRGAWVTMMTGGSRVNPKASGKGIPFDLSLAFHTDAGTTPNDSIIGTLSIYSLLSEGSQKLPNGEDRMTCRELADLVQTQIVNDVREQYEPQWSRRFLWDRSYSESRSTNVPAMLLEFLSHQNFSDMKYGLDPEFRFTVSRAIYKGILKYLSNRYGCSYEVEPLPVNSLAVSFSHKRGGNNKAEISWLPTIDSLESTADPNGYILYTRKDDGAFDEGTIIKAISNNGGRLSTEVGIEKGHLYSFKVTAFNDGGKSFPSEILSIGVPTVPNEDNTVMVVNNFDRVSGPTWFDTPSYAGFNDDLDSGIPYMNEINYIGEMYQFRRELAWADDDNPGFGASYSDQAGKLITGNTFDFPYIHGKALMSIGYPFYSVSRDAFDAVPDLWRTSFAADIICGKQVTTKIGRGAMPNKFSVFPAKFQDALRKYTAEGRNVLISGAHIGTDVWDMVYPISVDTSVRNKSEKFVEEVLGYKWLTNYASRAGQAWIIHNTMIDPVGITKPVSFHRLPNSEIYNVETVDGIVPASSNAKTFFRYTDTNISAAVCFKGNGYKVISFGFPIETVTHESDIKAIISNSMTFFKSDK